MHGGPIISGSDSLLADDSLLVRNNDYTIDYTEGVLYLDLTGNKPESLIVSYTPLPAWLKKRYGLQPESSAGPLPSERGFQPAGGSSRPSLQSSALTIRGAKKFSVVTQTNATSQFSQSLELTVQGELSPGLRISGSVADRGYDPAYGTVNARISELDKLNLKLSSRYFHSEVGNLNLPQTYDFGGLFERQVSGIQAVFDNRRLAGSVLFARPRGRTETAKFSGIDRVQGPYRISAGDAVSAIVPGSEEVWVNGTKMERGGDKDYVMDYPSGGITFAPRAMIDSRSRIEVDFEPLLTEYQREMYQITGGAAAEDSTAYIEVGLMREGDDKDRLKTGELGSEEIEFLETIGDSLGQSFRNGAVADTLGDYIQVFDSLGFSYYEYVGDSLGDFSVGFTAVGSRQGDYVYEGGNVYRFVGQNRGEYLPVVRIPVPSRESFYEIKLGFRPNDSSHVGLTVRQSDFDKNLYSGRDDTDNMGGQYVFSAGLGQTPSVLSARPGVAVQLNIVDRNFNPRTRRDRPDLARMYLVPRDLEPDGDRREFIYASSVMLPGPYNLHSASGFLDYDNQFVSYTGTVSIYPDTKRGLFPFLSYTRIKGRLDTLGLKLDGEDEILAAKLGWDFREKLSVGAAFNYDRRWNQYARELRGTTERQYDFSVGYRTALLTFQLYDEDTLVSDWTELMHRDRATFNVSQRLGLVKGDVYLVGQRLTQGSLTEEQLLARTNLSYLSVKHNLSVSVSYSLSDENRFERGLRYIEVDPGKGKYIFSDGQYIPDPEGNFIEIEEIHSNQASVEKGEKSFNLTYNPKDVYLKLLSNGGDELLTGGKRNLMWILPFYSDNGQPYWQRNLLYRGELKLLSFGSYYLVNLGASYNFESRLIGGTDYEKYEKTFRAGLNESAGDWRYIQEGTYFEYQRDSYYSSPGNINGFRLSVSVIRMFVGGQINGSLSYRFAEDQRESLSKQFILTLNPLFRLIEGGETSLKLQIHRQILDAQDIVSYRLTDNLYGRRGVIWSIRSDYKVKKNLKFTVSFNGRHSDDRKPRIVGRGELIASF